MKEIVNQYGALAAAIIILCALLYLLGKGAFYPKIKTLYANSPNRNIMNKEMNNSMFEQYSSRSGISVGYRLDNPIVAGEVARIGTHFEGKDCAGNSIQLSLELVEGDKGQTFPVREGLNGQSVCLECAGIYDFVFTGMDQNGKRQRCAISVPVWDRLPEGAI